MGGTDNMTLYMIIFAVVGAVLILLSIHLLLRVKKLEKRYRRFMKGKDALSLEQKFNREFGKLDALIEKQTNQQDEIKEIGVAERRNFTRYGVVKYDAFEDVGGKLSFALALLNDEDTGIVLNAIHSKDNCFLYLKEIMKGESYIMLSNEEVEALRIARNSEEKEVMENIMSTDTKDKKEERGEDDD